MNNIKCYLLFNKNNTLVCNRIYSDKDEAEPMRKQLSQYNNGIISTWKVNLIMEEKVNE